MSKFHSSVRDLFEDVHSFLTITLQNEVLSSSCLTHRERLLTQLSSFQRDYPELQLKFSPTTQVNETSWDKLDASRYSPSSPLPYVDMNGGSPYKIPFSLNVSTEDTSYDICLTKEKSENQSIAESDDYFSDDAKSLPHVAASELASCDKAGYLDKKKRESIKGWLNPFQRRWCAIKDGVLYYYEKISDRKQRGSILLAGYEVRTVLEDSNDGKKYTNCFELVCPGKRTYQFSAASEKDLQQWIIAVEKNCKVTYSVKLNNQNSSNLSTSNYSTNTESDLVDNTEDIYESVLEEDDKSENLNDKGEESALDNEEYSDVETALMPNEMFNYSEWYVGLWDCSSADDAELSFFRGDLIRIISKEYDSYAWWIGELQGKIGFVPKTYLMEAYETY